MEWRTVKNFEDYQVSEDGRVKNTITGKILKGVLPKTKPYLQVSLYNNNRRKNFKIHILVAVLYHNHTPCGFDQVIDHKDGNKLNNHKDNLRIVSNRVNTSSRVGGTSKYTGVHWNKRRNKWNSRILINGKRYNLGYFNSEEDAHRAYQKKLKELN